MATPRIPPVVFPFQRGDRVEHTDAVDREGYGAEGEVIRLRPGQRGTVVGIASHTGGPAASNEVEWLVSLRLDDGGSDCGLVLRQGRPRLRKLA